MSLYLSITGICALMSAVMAAHCEPGPNEKGCGVSALKGVASKAIERTCASSMTFGGDG